MKVLSLKDDLKKKMNYMFMFYTFLLLVEEMNDYFISWIRSNFWKSSKKNYQKWAIPI